MAGGMRDGRRNSPDAGDRLGRWTKYADPATAATSTTVTAAAKTAVRSRPPEAACWPLACWPGAAPGGVSAPWPGLPAGEEPGGVRLHLIVCASLKVTHELPAWAAGRTSASRSVSELSAGIGLRPARWWRAAPACPDGPACAQSAACPAAGGFI